jgi:outer membrane protein TolC
VEQAERETVYSVTRTYLTVLYAREQERLANGIVERLTATRDAAQRALNAGARDVSAAEVNHASVYLRLAAIKRTQAGQGVKRALDALREAMGLNPDETLEVPPGSLPDVAVHPSQDEIVAHALAHRAELLRAGVLVEVTCLEAAAQGTGHHRRVQTFAAGSDIHATQMPQGIQDTEYRPGAVPPEMPTLLLGSSSDRVKRAQSFNARALAVAETTRNLIVLEAKDAFLRWEEASLQIADAREAAAAGDKLAEDLSKDFTAGLRVKVADVVNAQVLASQARSQHNEYLYRQALALADLERITAGAFHSGLVDTISTQPAKKTSSANR